MKKRIMTLLLALVLVFSLLPTMALAATTGDNTSAATHRLQIKPMSWDWSDDAAESGLYFGLGGENRGSVWVEYECQKCKENPQHTGNHTVKVSDLAQYVPQMQQKADVVWWRYTNVVVGISGQLTDDNNQSVDIHNFYGDDVIDVRSEDSLYYVVVWPSMQVKVHCSTDDTHSDETYWLDPDTASGRITGIDENDKYVCEFTVKKAPFIEKFVEAVGCEHTDTQTGDTFTIELHSKFVWNNQTNVWTYPSGSNVITVKCGSGSSEDPEPEPPIYGDWTSKSKEATNLDTDFTSDVTLSLPSAQTELVSDVVFVLDKSTSAGLEDLALTMLNNLKTHIADVGGKVNVGVVIFNKKANVTGFMDLATEFGAIETAIKQEIKSGTNTHAGLLAGKAMLDNDTTTEASRKYLIFVSDGITYMFNEEPTAVAWTWNSDAHNFLNWAGPDNWGTKYGNTNAPADWAQWLADIKSKVEAQGDTYDYPYGGTVQQATPCDAYPATTYTQYANSIDKAIYLTNEVYQEAKAAGYHCYAMKAATSSGGTYLWGPSFMDYLADGKTIDFSTIQNDIVYAVDKGSTLVDTMGYVAGDYDFDFVDEIGTLELTVGDVEYPVQKQAAPDPGDTTTYTFGKEKTAEGVYPFVLHYVKAPADGEHFTLDINQPISRFQRVQLSYRVKLTNPKTEPGTYGVYDRYGENHENALFTNNSAILNPVGTGGVAGDPQEFLKPTVSYTIDENGEIVPDTLFGIWLNIKDHYSYLIGYSDGTVRPNGKITRAEVATIFFRLLTDDVRQRNWSSENHFSDVSADKWYNNAVSTLCHMGVLGGYSDGTFRPNAPITRAEFAKIAVSFSQRNGSAVYHYFTDVKTTDWFAPAVTAAKDNGLIEGYSDGSFKPENKITRAEACAIVNRVLGRKPSKSHMKISDRIDWPDCTTADWFYEAIMEATNSHTYQMGKRVETWNDKLPQRDWAELETGWASAYTGKGGEVH